MIERIRAMLFLFHRKDNLLIATKNSKFYKVYFGKLFPAFKIKKNKKEFCIFYRKCCSIDVVYKVY